MIARWMVRLVVPGMVVASFVLISCGGKGTGGNNNEVFADESKQRPRRAAGAAPKESKEVQIPRKRGKFDAKDWDSTHRWLLQEHGKLRDLSTKGNQILYDEAFDALNKELMKKVGTKVVWKHKVHSVQAGSYFASKKFHQGYRVWIQYPTLVTLVYYTRGIDPPKERFGLNSDGLWVGKDRAINEADARRLVIGSVVTIEGTLNKHNVSAGDWFAAAPTKVFDFFKDPLPFYLVLTDCTVKR